MSTIVSCLFGYYLDISFIFYAISDCRLNVLHVFLFHKKCCLYRYNVYIEGIIKYERWNIRRIIRQIPLLVISFEYMYIKFVGSKFMSWQRLLFCGHKFYFVGTNLRQHRAFQLHSLTLYLQYSGKNKTNKI